MRDSWIDRDELDELVGSFSPARKGKGRRIPVRAKSPKGSELKSGGDPLPIATAPAVPTEALASEPDTVVVLSETAGEVPALTDLAGVEPSIQEIPEAFLDVFEFDDESGDEDELEVGVPDDEMMEESSISVVVEEVVEVLAPPYDTTIEDESDESIGEIASVLRVEEESPPPLLNIPDEMVTAGHGGIEVPEPELPEPELVVSTVPEEEPMRELPLFLDDADDFVPRIPTLSERDADRALIALAEARSRAEQGGLLRGHRPPVDDGAAETEAPAPATVEEALQETPLEEAIAPVASPSVAVEQDFGEKEEGGTLSVRIERFVALARTELGVTAAAVSDRDGFLLFTQSVGEGDEEMETALLLEVAGRTDQLLGVERGSATQISTDGGAWRCLIRGGDGAGDLYAGFRLPRPLDQEEIVRWRNALAEIISPTLELR
jgi:hypothetical protein